MPWHVPLIPIVAQTFENFFSEVTEGFAPLFGKWESSNLQC
jgi:hypothetical protein